MRTIRDLFVRYRASTPVTLQFGFNELQDGLRAGTVASATFGLYRYKGLERQIANQDLAWSAPPSIGANDKHTLYGFQLSINANSPRKDVGFPRLRGHCYAADAAGWNAAAFCSGVR